MSCLIAQEPRNKCIRHDLAYLGDLSFVKWLSLCSGRASRIKYDDLARGAMTDGMNYFIVSFFVCFYKCHQNCQMWNSNYLFSWLFA